MDKKMILLFSGAGVAILAIIIVTVVLIVGMQNKPVNIAVTDFTTDMAYGLLEGYCNVSGEKANRYVNSYSVSDAYKKIIEGDTDVVLATDIDQDTLDWIKANNVEIEITPIAKDAIVFFNNTLNPVTNLTVNNIKDIYSAKVTNWSAVGGENLDIIAYPPKEDTEEVYMLTKFMGSRSVSKPRFRIPDVTVTKVYDAVSKYLDTRKKAMGYTTYNNSKNITDYDNVRTLFINGVKPTDESIRSGEYAGAMNIYAIIRKDTPANSQTRNFVNYILSQNGQDIINEGGYINLSK